jgi:hypothetical protein
MVGEAASPPSATQDREGSAPGPALKVLGTGRLTSLDVGLGSRQALLLVPGVQIGHRNAATSLEARGEGGDVVEALAEPSPHHGRRGMSCVTGESYRPRVRRSGQYWTTGVAKTSERRNAISSASRHSVGQRWLATISSSLRSGMGTSVAVSVP